MFKVYDFLESVKEKTNEMQWNEFTTLICMLMEEWCKANNDDVVEMSSTIARIVSEVNEEEGKY